MALVYGKTHKFAALKTLSLSEMKETVLKLFLTFSLICLAGMSAGAFPPFFTNYKPKDYGAANQNWSMAQDVNGYIYACNDDCLLRFNGKSWEKLYPFGEGRNIFLRSLYADRDSDRVYIGGLREFGYLVPAQDGSLTYVSLAERFDSEQLGNDQIWYIERVGNRIFFIFFSTYYVYDTDTEEVSQHYALTSWHYVLEGSLYLVQRSGEIRKYDGVSEGYDIIPPDALPGPAMKIFHSSSGGRIAICEKDGMYVSGRDGYRRVDGLGKDWGIANRAIRCSDGTVIVGFRGSGIYAFSETGHTLWHLDSDNGLINSTVHCLIEDSCGNVWAALAKGLVVIFKDGDYMIPPSMSNTVEITAAYVCGDRLYAGTKQGLSVVDLSSGQHAERLSRKIRPANQVWSISEVMGQIIVGDEKNTYRLDHGGGYTVLSDAPGGTEPRLVPGDDGRMYMIQGSFTSLYVYEQDGDGKWRFRNTVNGFLRPVNRIEVDHLGNLWLEHMYTGLYRLRLSGDLKDVVDVEYWGGSDRHICKVEGRVLFHDADGFSYYDDMTRRMMPYEVFNESLGEFRTCDMVTDARHGRYWLIRDDRAVLAGVSSDGRADIIDFVDCSKYDMSMSEPSTVASWNDDRYLVGTEQGFLVHHYVSGQSPDSLAVKILFRGICSQKADSRQTYNISDDRITVPNKSGLSVYAALTGERFPNRIKVESMLSGYDWSWQMLGDDMTASWQRLPAGTYRLELRASDAIGHEVARKEISVTVRPSLFASPVFLILYVLSFAGLCAMAVIFVRKLLERQRTALAKKNAEAMEQEMLKHERDLMSIRNEQLEESVLLKSKELATYSLIEARRNNVLKHLSEELSRIYYSDRPGIHKKDYDRLMEIIRDGEFTEDNWNHFFTNFDLIHKSFFRSLKAMHGDLTPNDLRLCAYLRLNMSTKEIANIMGITVKGAEVAKYRLRKKLQVDSSMPLNVYLMSLSSAKK